MATSQPATAATSDDGHRAPTQPRRPASPRTRATASARGGATCRRGRSVHRLGRSVPSGARREDKVEAGSCRRTRSCSGLHLGRRLDAELLVEGVPQSPVGVQRVRLTAGPVEREHPDGGELLTQRVAARRGRRASPSTGRGGRGPVSASHPRLRWPLTRSSSSRVPPVPRPVQRREVGQYVTAPHRQRRRRAPSRRAVGSVGQRCATGADQRLEPSGRRGSRAAVSRRYPPGTVTTTPRGAPFAPCRLDDLAQMEHVRLQRRLRHRRRRALPRSRR